MQLSYMEAQYLFYDTFRCNTVFKMLSENFAKKYQIFFEKSHFTCPLADMGSPRPPISPVEPDILVFNCMCHFSSGMLEEAKKKDAYRDFSLCDLNKDNLEKYYKQFDHEFVSVALYWESATRNLR